MNRKILATRWYSQNDLKHPVLGIVAAETDNGRTWCAYVGTGKSSIIDHIMPEQIAATEHQDQQFISNNGGKLLASEAAGIFPDLDITKYKKS